MVLTSVLGAQEGEQDLFGKGLAERALREDHEAHLGSVSRDAPVSWYMGNPWGYM